MSYCRWSSDDNKSDVYCYESNSGHVIHVAMYDRSMVKVGLSCDGETYSHLTLKEAYQKLLRLRTIGYHVPQSALDRMKDEMEEVK